MEAPTRKRKAHRKSRAGCRNCKLRRVKCDETRPACQNCIGLLVTCNYDSTPSSASSSAVVLDGDLNFSMSEINVANDALVTDFNRMVASQYPQTSDAGKFRSLNTYDIDRLKRWHTRTVFTLGTQGISLCYQVTVSKEITQYPYLLHAVLAMAAMHDGHFLAPADSRSPDDSKAIHYYHLSCAAALFNERLSKPSDMTTDRNAIWTTACILGNMASFSVPTTEPELSWPLTSSSDSDLKWMEIYRGLNIIYKLSSPIDPGGMFHLLMQEPSHTFLKSKWDEDLREGIEDIPPQFVALCDLTPTSNYQNNPYHATVRLLAAIWDMECTRATAFRFLSFILLMRQGMKDLLKQKDARALLLLAHWYTKMFHAHWWFSKRAIIECNAICIYLKRYNSSEPLLMDMLETPMARLAELASESVQVT